jgi:hypothetical protein
MWTIGFVLLFVVLTVFGIAVFAVCACWSFGRDDVLDWENERERRLCIDALPQKGFGEQSSR